MEPTPEKITFRYLWLSVRRVLNFDEGITFTLKNWFLNPGESAREFLFVNRSKYVGPVKVLLLLAAIYSILLFNLTDYEAQLIEYYGNRDMGDVFTLELTRILGKYFNVFLFLSVPFYGFTSYIFFDRERWNLAEHSALSMYIISMRTVIGIAFMWLYSIDFMLATYSFLALGIVYTIIANKSIFRLSWPETLWRSLFAYFMAFGAYTMCIAFFTGIYVGFNLARQGAL